MAGIVRSVIERCYRPMQRRLETYLDRTAASYKTSARQFLDQRAPTSASDNSWSPLLTFEGARTKRLIDIGFGIIGTGMLGPISLAVVPIVLLSSPGPLVYLHKREGLFGLPIKTPKFRTMFVGTEHPAPKPPDPGNFLFWKPDNDPRVTPIGRYLRKYGIDEWPQFVSILQGKMSFVGPRAILSEELDQLGNQYNWRVHRRKVLPSLMHAALILNGGYPTNKEVVELEMYYLANWSPAMDFKIACRGLIVLVAGRHK